tara:strand:- start:195 stop:530 length:336 start_codon:yes stop_codon:yes gene_type:complete
MVYNLELDPNYTSLLFFFTIKIIINFKKCTVAYVEYKLRGVKEEEGYLNQFFDKLFEIRNENEKLLIVLLILSISILYYAVFVNNNNLYIMFHAFKELSNKLTKSIKQFKK